jgi:hypothetical protein
LFKSTFGDVGRIAQMPSSRPPDRVPRDRLSDVPSEKDAAMTANHLGVRVRVGLAGLCLGLLWLAAPGRAEAQFGWGWGWGAFDYRPMSVENIYSRSNMAGGAAFANRQQGLQAPYRPRDLDFTERAPAESRGAADARVAYERRLRSLESQMRAQAAAPPTPKLPLAGFFDKYDHLTWPSEAPTSGDLQGKRDAADRASLLVLQDVRGRGFSSLGLVTDARDKLLEYGRPALQLIRSVQTPVIAESFHVFLMALYDSLEQSATPPGSAAAPSQPRR